MPPSPSVRVTVGCGLLWQDLREQKLRFSSRPELTRDSDFMSLWMIERECMILLFFKDKISLCVGVPAL